MSHDSLAAGTLLGPYEIVDQIGSGGMGDVYRARDQRLGRDVAIKVLPAEFSNDADRLRRFELEGRAVSQLNHPNIVALYDVGEQDGLRYVCMELLEGESFDHVLEQGPLPVRKAIHAGIGIARALSAAHEKGIVHRDLKPANVFLTSSGDVKVLDFGLAQQTTPPDQDQTSAATRTQPGHILGTVGYMAPEQIRGEDSDNRSDIFSLGAVLYEMIFGERAFHGETAPETMTAILRSDPEAFSQLHPQLPAGVLRVLEHCLEKDPERRFQSAQDLVFALESSREFGPVTAGVSVQDAGDDASTVSPRTKALLASGWAVAALVLLAATAAFLYWRPQTAPELAPPTFHRLTFEQGIVQSARFTEDGSTVVYAATWDGGPLHLHMLRTGRSESRELELPPANLLSLSPEGEMAISLGAAPFDWFSGGTLSQVGLLANSPRDLMERVVHADWAPDGQLAVWRVVTNGAQLEYPVGNVLYSGAAVALAMRVSPSGETVAVHLLRGGLTGDIVLFGTDGEETLLASGLVSAPGLAWSEDGREVWFAATPAGRDSATPAVWAVDLTGKQRLVLRTPGWLWLHDINRQGQALLAHNQWQGGLVLSAGESSEPMVLNWLDWSALADLTSDASAVLFTESREGVDNEPTVYVRSTDGSPATPLGRGVALSFSPDAQTVLALQPDSTGRQRLALLPTGAGNPEVLDLQLNPVWGDWLPDGRIVVAALDAEGAPATYILGRDGSEVRQMTPTGVLPAFTDPEGGGAGVQAVSPDGGWIFAVGGDRLGRLYPTAAGQPRDVPGLEPGERPAGWTADGSSLYVWRPEPGARTRIDVIDLSTGERRLFREITAPQRAGTHRTGPYIVSTDGETLAFGYQRTLSTLYLAEGLL